MKMVWSGLAAVCFAASLVAAPAHAQRSEFGLDPAAEAAAIWPVTPRLRDDGEKWRIGYFEGGQYRDYEVILKATLRGLMALGWIEDMELPPHNDPEPGGFWRWFAEHAQSEYLEFPADAWHAPGDFDPELRPQVREVLHQRLRETRDLDLVIAMGTWAGQDLAVDGIDTPVVVGSTSDPVAAGIVASANDSGREHLHAKTEPGRYGRQIELFHDIFGFERLGLVFEDSPEGRTFAAVDEIESIAAERGFEIVGCNAPFNGVSQDEATEAAVQCYAELAPRIDAAYVTVHRGVNPRSLPRVIEPLLEHGLPSFSMQGEDEVRQGVLMSIAQLNYIYVGRFHAETVARILNGATPRALPQVWQAPSKIALNLETAERIGYDPTVDILMASDEIFATISPPPSQP